MVALVFKSLSHTRQETPTIQQHGRLLPSQPSIVPPDMVAFTTSTRTVTIISFVFLIPPHCSLPGHN